MHRHPMFDIYHKEIDRTGSNKFVLPQLKFPVLQKTENIPHGILNASTQKQVHLTQAIVFILKYTSNLSMLYDFGVPHPSVWKFCK